VPGAVESDTCFYKTNGCISSTALNYNPEATTDDGSCVEPTVGCTLKNAGYDGVAATTPGYKSRYVGKPLPNVGLVTWTEYGSVTNYNSAANVLLGCVVAVEGCMDSSAVNYDPKATVNTGTWCVPLVRGCMMPSQATLSFNTASMTGRAHALDGGAYNFNPLATLNDKSSCVLYRVGCTNSTAVNYDPKATEDDASCFYNVTKAACLNRFALNFNCSSLDSYAPCTDTITDRFAVPTVHDPDRCHFVYSPPPIPSPSIPPGVAVVTVVQVQLTAAGTVSDYTEDKQTAIKQAFATHLSILISLLRLYITAGSVNIVVEIEVADDAAAQNVQTSIATEMASPEAATSFLSAAGVEVLSTPVIATKVVAAIGPPAPPPASSAGGIIGGVVGGIGGLLMLIGIGAFLHKRSKGKTYPA